MKFESKFGLGELVCIEQKVSCDRAITDVVARIVAITFYFGGSTNYTCRLENGMISNFLESELIGDPEFNHELGDYPAMGNGG